MPHIRVGVCWLVCRVAEVFFNVIIMMYTESLLQYYIISQEVQCIKPKLSYNMYVLFVYRALFVV